jgi:hypothetical protein
MSNCIDCGANTPFPYRPKEPGNLPEMAWSSILLAHGMTLRDAFALAAMQGFLSGNYDTRAISPLGEKSYQVADAMLKQREKP